MSPKTWKLAILHLQFPHLGFFLMCLWLDAWNKVCGRNISTKDFHILFYDIQYFSTYPTQFGGDIIRHHAQHLKLSVFFPLAIASTIVVLNLFAPELIFCNNPQSFLLKEQNAKLSLALNLGDQVNSFPNDIMVENNMQCLFKCARYLTSSFCSKCIVCQASITDGTLNKASNTLSAMSTFFRIYFYSQPNTSCIVSSVLK